VLLLNLDGTKFFWHGQCSWETGVASVLAVA
jgi:hypothetical protein